MLGVQVCIASQKISYASQKATTCKNQERRNKMKSQLNRMLIVATVALLGVAASALPAAAQGVAGHFTLPHAVRWQNADLAAGEYTFSLPSLTTMSAMTVKGPKGA